MQKEALQTRIEAIESAMGAADFWADKEKAQALQEMFPAEYLPSFFLCLDRDTVFTHFEGELSEDSFRAMLDSMKSAPRNIIN